LLWNNARVRRFLRYANAAAVALALLSSFAVLGSTLLEPGYAERHADPTWFIVGYAVVHGYMLWAFVRDTPVLPWVALARAVSGVGFLLTFALTAPLGLAWTVATPGRYVYQLFDTEGTKLPLFAMLLLGRGAWNTFSAFYFTQPWWGPLRHTRPLLGRLITAVPIAAIVFCTWGFLELVRMEARTYSQEAHDVAAMVLGDLDCPGIQSHDGQTTTDIRQRGDRRYNVEIKYGCAYTRVRVQDPDGKLGVASGSRMECCDARRVE